MLAEMGRRAGVQFVVAAGGGTVIDTGKAVAAMIPARGVKAKAWVEAAGTDVPCPMRKASPPLPLVSVPSTLVGALAAGSPRAHLRVPDEDLLTAPRWDARLQPLAEPSGHVQGSAGAGKWLHSGLLHWRPRAGPGLVYADPSLLAPAGDGDGLAALVAAAADLVWARRTALQRPRGGDSCDDDDDDDDALPAADISDGDATRSLSRCLVALQEVLARQLSLPVEAAPPGSPFPFLPLCLSPADRALVLCAALELGALSGDSASDVAPCHALARALHVAHLPHEPFARVLPGVAGLLAPAHLASRDADPRLTAALKSAALAAPIGAPNAHPESGEAAKAASGPQLASAWVGGAARLVGTWAAQDVPALLLSGGRPRSPLRAIDGSSAAAMAESVAASALTALPLAGRGAGLRSLGIGGLGLDGSGAASAAKAGEKGARAALTRLLAPIADPLACE